MFTHLSHRDGMLFLHMAEVSSKATASFTRGSILINSEEWTATFGSAAPVALPQGFVFGEGSELQLQLVAPDGTVRTQKRKITLLKGKQEGLRNSSLLRRLRSSNQGEVHYSLAVRKRVLTSFSYRDANHSREF
jgi:hypothetical protein